MKVAHSGMATVCPPGYSANPNWQRKPGQRQCLKNKVKRVLKKVAAKKAKLTLKQLQSLARANVMEFMVRVWLQLVLMKKLKKKNQQFKLAIHLLKNCYSKHA